MSARTTAREAVMRTAAEEYTAHHAYSKVRLRAALDAYEREARAQALEEAAEAVTPADLSCDRYAAMVDVDEARAWLRARAEKERAR